LRLLAVYDGDRCMYVNRLLICNKRTYYTIEIHKIMKMQMNKKKEKEHNTQINTSNQTMKQIREIKNLNH